MSTIVNNDKLNLILTQYGLSRIAEAVENPSLTLNITKIKLGNGRNEEYYEPSPTQESLEGDLGVELYIYDKALLEDQETISFHTVISDNIGGFDIREVGLYETVGDEDKLFAISTQQPFVKPTTADNYFINIDYYIFLKITNVKNIYDQIVLDSNYALVTEPNLEELMRTFLFAHGNLINQIGNNSRIIGYNRPTQLWEIINENKKDYSYITLYKTYASLVDIAGSSNIFSYWAFDYSRRRSNQDSVVDLSSNKNYLSVSQDLGGLPHVYNGFMSMFTFESPQYFKLSSQIPLNLFSSEKNTDLPFTMIFAIEPLDYTTKKTLLAKSDYANNKHTFEVSELANRSLELKLFSSSSDYLTFTSAANTIPEGPHSIVLTYEPENKKAIAFINSSKYELQKVETGTYTHMDEVPGVLYCYGITPVYTIYANSDSTPTTLYNADGTVYTISTNSDWQIENGEVKYKGETATYDGSTTAPTMYAWTYDDGIDTYTTYTQDAVITQDTQLYNSNYLPEENTLFSIQQVGSSYKVFYDNYETTANGTLPTRNLYCYKVTLEIQKIWANSTVNPVLLYDENAQIYTGTDWTISNAQVLYQGSTDGVNRIATNDVQTYVPDLTSYVVGTDGKPSININSNIGLVSVVREKLSDENARIMALNLCATMGRNPYLSGS